MSQTVDVDLFYIAFICYTVAMLITFFTFWKKTGKAAVIGRIVLLVGLVFQVVGLVIRSYHARFMPVTNMYESMNLFSCLIVLAYLVVDRRLKNRSLGVFILPVIFLLMAFSSLPSTSKEIMPLIPALQSQWLVWHVILSFIGEAGFAVAFCASIMYLIRKRSAENSFIAQTFPSLTVLDTISYRAIAVGFPIFTIGAIIFGAVWAKYAWGDYWSWDPKETWALITWIVYALYLHARIVHGWKGTVAALISIIGFLATMFTLFGVNYLISGLHSYT
ncbi:MAG: c-type cytochrome biogenesis protein CcsB [Candidatus Latescibacteria bacterium]|jgi:cytochrome c-type biogenesis protein CcsB|nr:c-type cytochrome biogenesis protein CcsB [Candidatus Latescibacterota bacterium]